MDFLREALRVLVDGIMDAEPSGAQHGEPERVTSATATWDTRVMELHIPKLREGSYFPSLLEPRRRSLSDQQAYVEGVSTRRVDDLIKALGCDGISQPVCEQLDEVVESFLGRPPTADGQREILGMDVGASEDGAFWLAFLRSLTARGLSGVELATSDAHQGLKNAIAAVFAGASWQRCRTHFMANLLTRVPKRAQPGVATMVRTIYQQLSPAEVHGQLDRVVEQLREPFAQLLADAAPDILAFTAFPVAHWQKRNPTAEPVREHLLLRLIPPSRYTTATVGQPSAPPKAPADRRRQHPVYPNSSPDHRACNSLTLLPLSSRRPSVSIGGFGVRGIRT